MVFDNEFEFLTCIYCAICIVFRNRHFFIRIFWKKIFFKKKNQKTMSDGDDEVADVVVTDRQGANPYHLTVMPKDTILLFENSMECLNIPMPP